MSTCCILDEAHGRVLVQHSDLDFNIYGLEIIQGKERREFDMPSFITRLAPQGYVARLLPDEDDIIEIYLWNDDAGIDKADIDWAQAARHVLQPRDEEQPW